MAEMTAETDTTPAELVSVAEISVEPDSVTVAWTTDELIYGLIEYGTTSAYGSQTAEGTIAMMGHEQTISGLRPETTYYYRIRMRDEAGNISYSAPRSFATAPAPQAADEASPTISDITVSDITVGSASVSFTADEPVRARIEYGTTAAYGASLPFTDEYADTQTFSLAGLAEGTEYHFRLIAEDQAGNTTTTFDETFTTLAPEPPPEAALAASNVEVASVGTSTARITWSTNKSADGQVFYGTTASYGSASALGAEGASHAITLTGLTPATHYYFKVVSKTSSGETASSAGDEFNTLAQPAKPATPLPSISNVRIESVATSSAVVRWATNVAVPSRLEYGRDTAYGSVFQDSASATAHSAPLTNLLASTIYHFRITARDSKGNTALSKDYNFTTRATSVSADANAQIPTQAPTLTTPSPVSSSTPVSAAIQPLQIVAPPTQPKYGGGIQAPPIKPQLIRVEALDGQAAFVWLRNFSEKPNTQIRIIRGTDSALAHRNDGEVVFDGNARAFTDTGLQNGVTYHYGIFAYDVFNRFSRMVKVSVTPRAGKEELVLQAEPTEAPATPAFTFTQNLFPTTDHPEVLHLQAVLAQYPALYPEGQVTGYYGEQTKQAIARLQAKYRLPKTGYADARTRTKLEALSLVPRVWTGSEATAFSRDLAQGAKGEEVRQLQQFLGDQGFFEGEDTGYFGIQTRSALIRFQNAHHITPASGFFGPLTRERASVIGQASRLGL